jgi:hypothetical protein
MLGVSSIPMPANTSDALASAPSRAQLQEEVDDLSARLEAEKEARKEHDDDASYFMNVVAIIIGVAAIIFTVGGIVATVAGYRFIRDYVESVFGRRADAAFETHGKPLLERRAMELEAAVDARLAEQLEEFHQARGGRVQ